jgi:hypothetical protein
MNNIMNSKIYFIKNPKTEEKLLPFQYYNLYKFITIPITTNDKKPFIKGWNLTKKTIHPTYIDQNIGILTGKVNNITVLDIDEKLDGIQYWKEISKQYDEIITPMVKSPTGIHIYFKYNKKLTTTYRIKVNGKKIGWDIKSDNSVITSPPSIIDGNRYKWIKNKSLDDVKIISMPKWLENIIINNLK